MCIPWGPSAPLLVRVFPGGRGGGGGGGTEAGGGDVRVQARENRSPLLALRPVYTTGAAFSTVCCRLCLVPTAVGRYGGANFLIKVTEVHTTAYDMAGAAFSAAV
jgi:hypothetical protein